MNKLIENHAVIDGKTSPPNHFPIDPKDLGGVDISPKGSFEAGSFQTFKLVYTAGKYELTILVL